MGQIAQQSPSLATILRPNLPRPKILRSLLSLAHIKDDQGVYRIADIDPVTVTECFRSLCQVGEGMHARHGVWTEGMHKGERGEMFCVSHGGILWPRVPEKVASSNSNPILECQTH